MDNSWTGDPTVRTLQGTVRGFEDGDDSWVWKAVPFARPPVGDLRWKAPRDPVPWEGLRAETEFAERACQNRMLQDEVMGSEDCLYLNVWRPRSDETGLPVYFWIHGGGNTIQQPTLKITHGANIAVRSNVVFVSINYRLGEFGWFSHPALRSGRPGDEFDDSGNYGILDIIKALEWVRDNIAAFGGNPGNVLVAGESAGGFNALTLVISPVAAGLFHKVMSESGGARTRPVAEVDADANAVIAQMLVDDGTAADLEDAARRRDAMALPEMAAYLRARPFEAFYRCRARVPFAMANAADGVVIPAAGYDTLDSGAYPSKVPMILGTNKEERKFSLYFRGGVEDEELYQQIGAFGSDLWKASGVDGLLRSLSANADQPPVYGYQFCWGARRADGSSPLPEPYATKLGAGHAMEIPFFFGIDRTYGPMDRDLFNEDNRPGREALTAAMMTYVARFVRTGDPNEPAADASATRWQPWSNDAGGPKCIIFDVDGDAADIAMTTEECTRESVTVRLEALSEPLRSKVREAVIGRLL